MCLAPTHKPQQLILPTHKALTNNETIVTGTHPEHGWLMAASTPPLTIHPNTRLTYNAVHSYITPHPDDEHFLTPAFAIGTLAIEHNEDVTTIASTLLFLPALGPHPITTLLAHTPTIQTKADARKAFTVIRDNLADHYANVTPHRVIQLLTHLIRHPKPTYHDLEPFQS